jgi:MoaA/NifB/PqqE/SkfB family radical SAM enzyme
VHTQPVQIHRVPSVSGEENPLPMSLDFLWLELTRKCNLRCTHCYADSEPSLKLKGPMTVERWKQLMAEARDLGCDRVQFIGGEVLLVPYLKELIHEARVLGFAFIEVFTNATAITNSTIEYFKRYSVSVAASFYSCDASVHDQITQRPGSWKNTVSALGRLQAADLDVRVGVIALPTNEQDVNAAVSFVRALGISDVGIDQVRSVGRAKALRATAGYLEELCGQCGRNRLCITTEGEILPCIMARSTSLGNYISSGGLEHATSWRDLAAFRSDLLRAKGVFNPQGDLPDACMPECWPNGGCSPHDMCKPHGKK